MDFPKGNKLTKGLTEEVESSAKLLEEHLARINYKLFIKTYFIGLSIFLVTLFSIIVTVRLAKLIF
jgi:hypothetical protein